MSTMVTRIVHLSIERDWQSVYRFASDPKKMPLWASGLASGLTPDGEDWVATGLLGAVHIRFAPPNGYGVIDHTVTLGSGLRVHNALRVVPNGDGCEVIFMLLRLAGMTDAQFDADAAHVAKDLATLKSLMESAIG